MEAERRLLIAEQASAVKEAVKQANDLDREERQSFRRQRVVLLLLLLLAMGGWRMFFSPAAAVTSRITRSQRTIERSFVLGSTPGGAGRSTAVGTRASSSAAAKPRPT